MSPYSNNPRSISAQVCALALASLILSVRPTIAEEPADSANIPEALREFTEQLLEESPRRLYSTELQNAMRSTLIGSPRVLSAEHSLGQLSLTRTNQGHFRTTFFPSTRGETYASAGSIWIGAIVGRDTLVSSGIDDAGVVEFWPDEFATLERRSMNPNDERYHPEAISEQDIITTYYDTLNNQFFVGQDPIENRLHRPLGLKVVERSMQWSYDYASDFIMFDYEITNLNKYTLNDVYIGIYLDGDTYFTALPDDPRFLSQIIPDLSVSGSVHDDLCGLLATYPADCGFVDTLKAAYILDNDGDPNPPHRWSSLFSLRHVTGIKTLRTPSEFAREQFNWWISGPAWYDSGPRRLPSDGSDLRDMNGFLGTPYGDRNKYYVMSNGETDYHQVYSAVNQEGNGWIPPHSRATFHSRGGNVKFLLSYGPFTLHPGQIAPLTYAYIAGENVHRNATDFRDLHNPLAPEPFLNSLDFSDFATNTRWAEWIYDNPGIDTDFDGYRGKTRDCVLSTELRFDTTLEIDSILTPPDTTIIVDTIEEPSAVETQFYSGDGIPDFVGASPPPAPLLRVIPEEGQLILRWNGFFSETTPDPFTDLIDFEGYRLYTSFTGVAGQFTLHSSYDIANYNRYTYNAEQDFFELKEIPFSLEELQQLYGPGFNPADYGVDNPLVHTDQTTGSETVYYFATNDWNLSELSGQYNIHKRYPDAPKPPNDENLWLPEDLTDDGHLKYYEYEYTIENLLPSMPLYVSVTAFDYGSPRVNLPSLETSPRLNMKLEFPLNSSAQAQANDDPIIVYPNPYRSDGDYRGRGYEARDRPNIIPERTREIHFVNLPLVCTISIYSLDGDLVRKLEHNRQDGGERSMHASWNVLSRNLQPVTSGIYYWVVEEPDGATHVGKLAIIM